MPFWNVTRMLLSLCLAVIIVSLYLFQVHKSSWRNEALDTELQVSQIWGIIRSLHKEYEEVHGGVLIGVLRLVPLLRSFIPNVIPMPLEVPHFGPTSVPFLSFYANLKHKRLDREVAIQELIKISSQVYDWNSSVLGKLNSIPLKSFEEGSSKNNQGCELTDMLSSLVLTGSVVNRETSSIGLRMFKVALWPVTIGLVNRFLMDLYTLLILIETLVPSLREAFNLVPFFWEKRVAPEEAQAFKPTGEVLSITEYVKELKEHKDYIIGNKQIIEAERFGVNLLSLQSVDLRNSEKIGSGHYGTCYKKTFAENEKPVIIKLYYPKTGDIWDPLAVEVNNMITISGVSGIPKLYGVSPIPPYAILMEYGGTLTFKDWLHRNCSDQYKVILTLKRITEIVAELQKKKMSHNDLHTRNIVIDDETEEPMIIDFNHMKSFGSFHPRDLKTLPFLQRRGLKAIGKEVDIYALGAIFKKAKLMLTLNKGLTDMFVDLIKKCRHRNIASTDDIISVLDDMLKQLNNPTQSYIICRHGERLDHINRSWHATLEGQSYFPPVSADPSIFPKTLPKRSNINDFKGDTPLTVRGQKAAYVLGQNIKPSGTKISSIYSSPMYHCISTADSIAKGAGMTDYTINIEPGLLEWTGFWHGSMKNPMTAEELLKNGYNVSLDYNAFMKVSDLNLRESMASFISRQVAATKHCLNDDARKCGDGTVLLSAHGSSLCTVSTVLTDKREPGVLEVLYHSYIADFLCHEHVKLEEDGKWRNYMLPYADRKAQEKYMKKYKSMRFWYKAKFANCWDPAIALVLRCAILYCY